MRRSVFDVVRIVLLAGGVAAGLGLAAFWGFLILGQGMQFTPLLDEMGLTGNELILLAFLLGALVLLGRNAEARARTARWFSRVTSFFRARRHDDGPSDEDDSGKGT